MQDPREENQAAKPMDGPLPTMDLQEEVRSIVKSLVSKISGAAMLGEDADSPAGKQPLQPSRRASLALQNPSLLHHLPRRQAEGDG